MLRDNSIASIDLWPERLTLPSAVRLRYAARAWAPLGIAGLCNGVATLIR
jgi:hypothetical protein